MFANLAHDAVPAAVKTGVLEAVLLKYSLDVGFLPQGAITRPFPGNAAAELPDSPGHRTPGLQHKPKLSLVLPQPRLTAWLMYVYVPKRTARSAWEASEQQSPWAFTRNCLLPPES